VVAVEEEMREVTIITCQEDMVEVAGQMKALAENFPCTDTVPYSSSEKEALEKALEGDEEKITFFNRAVKIGPLLFSLELTLDRFEGKNEWHLSMGRVDGPELIRKPGNGVAKEMANAFFGDDPYTESQEGVMQVRHFLCPLVQR
jgi:hypothetical protein